MNTVKKIVIAIDDGPASEKVVSIGFQLGQQLNAEIALVSIVDTTMLLTDGAVTPRELANRVKNDYKKNHKMLIDKLCNGCKVWTFVEEGKPFEAILKVADEWNADLIVLGTHGRTGLTHILMGSVAEKIVRHSAKPLFIIPIRL